MARIIDAFTQYCDGAGNPLARGKLYFYGIGALSTTAKDTFSVTDETLGTENANPLLLDGEGRVPPCFGTGSYTIKLTDKNDTTIDTFTPVGGTDSLDPFADWSTLINYQIASQPVKGSNSFYYKSRTDNNLGNDPVSDGGVNWVRIRFLGDYNSLTSYVIGDVVIDSSANLWASQTDPNLNNTPSADNGTNWLPAIDGSKVPEVITLETRTTTVIPLTGGGALTALRINELQDAGAYTLPLANTVIVNQTITITQPDAYTAFAPTVTRSGSDTITYSGGTDTSITFNSGSSISLTLTSNGVSDWRI